MRSRGTKARGHRFPFPRRMRLQSQAGFQSVYASQVRRKVGPLLVSARPNGRAHSRLGLAVGRKVGSACVRNLIKRRLREAFRLQQHDGPGGYDVVIRVQRHEPLTLADYQRHLAHALRGLHRKWTSKDPDNV